MIKKLLALLAVILMLAVIFLLVQIGVSGKDYNPSNVERITLVCIAPDYPIHEVFVITPDNAVKQYDFTSYWVHNRYDYFADPLPPKSEYRVNEWRINETDWKHIVEVLKTNRFLSQPEKMTLPFGEDLPYYYIEMVENGTTHISGGYGAIIAYEPFRNAWTGINAYLQPVHTPPAPSDGMIAFTFFHRGGSAAEHYYHIFREGDVIYLQLERPLDDDTDPVLIPIDEDVLSGLQEVIDKHQMHRWHGFVETNPNALPSTEKDQFTLSIIYDNPAPNGTICVISAYGDNAFPDGFEEAEEALVEFFDNFIHQ